MLKRYRVALFLTLMVISAAALSACDLGSSPQDSPAPATALTVPAESAPTVESVVQKSAPAPDLGTESRPGLWAQAQAQAQAQATIFARQIRRLALIRPGR